MEELPKYKPEQWIVFSKKDNAYMGQIVGAKYYMPHDEQVKKWHYTTISRPDVTHSVVEDEVEATFDGTNWRRNGPAKSLGEAGIAY